MPLGRRDTPDELKPESADPKRAAAYASVRALGVLLCVAGGTLLARNMPWIDPALWFAAATLLGALVLLWWGRLSAGLIFIGLLSLSAGYSSARLNTVPNDSLLLRVSETLIESPVRVRGVILSFPEVHEPERDPLIPFSMGYTRLELRLTSAMVGTGDRRAWENVSGWVALHAPIEAAGDERFMPGRWIEARGVLRTPSPRMNPGEPDWLGLARQRNSAGFLRVPDLALLSAVPASGSSLDDAVAWRARVLSGLRKGARDRLGLSDPVEDDEMISALLLGVRGDREDKLPRVMRRLGLAHLMAISGFHLALAAGFTLLVLRAVRDLGVLEPILLAAVVVLYVAVLPVRTPVLRAMLLVLGLLLGRALGRRYDSRSVLWWIGVLLLVWRPLDVFNMGYLLSVGITGLLLTMRVPSGVRVDQSAGRMAGSILRWPIRVGSVCLRCWAVGQPVVLAQAGVLSPFAWLATLIVVLPVTLLLIGGYLALAISVVWPSGGRWMIEQLRVPSGIIVDLVTWMDALPGAWFQLALMPWWAAGGLFVAVVCVVLRPRRWVRWGVLLVTVAVSIASINIVSRVPSSVRVRIDTLSVGNGSCHVIRSGGEVMLFDVGSMSSGLSLQLANTLRSLGINRVPSVIISHPNVDHYNALPELLETFGVQRVLLTEAFLHEASTPGPESAILELLSARRVEVMTMVAGETFTLGAARVDVLWPPPGIVGGSSNVFTSNDTSVVMRLHVSTDRGTRSVLFTGDLGEFSIEEFIASKGIPRVDVLEAPHHGSYNAASEMLLREMQPSVVLQSTGPSRRMESRWDSVKTNCVWISTAESGCITTTLRADGSIGVRTVR